MFDVFFTSEIKVLLFKITISSSVPDVSPSSSAMDITNGKADTVWAYRPSARSHPPDGESTMQNHVNVAVMLLPMDPFLPRGSSRDHPAGRCRESAGGSAMYRLRPYIDNVTLEG